MWFDCLSCSLFKLSETYVAFWAVFFFFSSDRSFSSPSFSHLPQHPLYLVLVYEPFQCSDSVANQQDRQSVLTLEFCAFAEFTIRTQQLSLFSDIAI